MSANDDLSRDWIKWQKERIRELEKALADSERKSNELKTALKEARKGERGNINFAPSEVKRAAVAGEDYYRFSVRMVRDLTAIKKSLAFVLELYRVEYRRANGGHDTDKEFNLAELEAAKWLGGGDV